LRLLLEEDLTIYSSNTAPLGQLDMHTPHPLHSSALNVGLNVFLSTNSAPLGQAFTAGQYGFMSQSF